MGGAQQPTGEAAYSGIDSVLQQLGGKMYDPASIKAELAVQLRGTPGDPTNRTSFREFVVNVQEFRVYLAMLGNQTHVSMIHTPGVYYSLASATSTYQGRVLAFIGDRRATKEPTPICLPTTKTWEWHAGEAITDFDKFREFHEVEANRGNLWTPTAGDGTPSVLGVPNLLAIPNILVDLLRNQGSAITPHDVLATIDEFIQDSGDPGQQWEYVRKWCLVAGQANTNGKSKVWLDTTPVTVDDEDFDRWVGTRLDIAFGPRPPTAAGPSAGVTGNQPAMDFLKLSQMLSTTIGTNMLQFSQAVNPTGGPVGATGSETALATGKGFDQDQIAKLKDACGVPNAQQIPAIWSVIQATKGKSFDSYRAHIAKSLEMWCRSHHIDRDKSIFLEAKFFEDLVALRFNPGGPVAQYHSVARGMSMLACRSLTAMAAEFCREYEEAADNTRHTRSLDDLLKKNRGKTVEPAATYTDLKLNIGTYCGLLWTIFGDHCDYYKELLKIYRILDHEECFTIRNAYTREVCARITWAIVDEGRSFFGRNPVASDFAPGTNFTFSTCLLEGITDSVRNAIPIQRAMFPREWSTPPLKSPDAKYGGPPYGGPPLGPPPTWGPIPAPPPTPPVGPTPPGRGGYEDTRHLKIKLLMDPYLKRYNNYVNIPEILTASGKRMSDLPTLPQYCHPTGQSFLCWNGVLGRCFRGPRCRFARGHIKKGDSTDAFADSVTDVISKGVLHFINLPLGEGGDGSSPKNKRKGGGVGAPADA